MFLQSEILILLSYPECQEHTKSGVILATANIRSVNPDSWIFLVMTEVGEEKTSLGVDINY